MHGVLGALFLGAAFERAAAAGAAAARHDQHDRGRCGAGRTRRRHAGAPARHRGGRRGRATTSCAGACSRSTTIPARPGERGMFFGAAGIYDGIHLCTGNIHTRGLTGSWASTATLLTVLGRALMRGVESIGIGGAEVGVTVDGVAEGRRPRALVLATTLDRLVLSSRPFWNNGGGPIHFTVVDHPAVGPRPPRRQLLYRRQDARSAGPAVPQQRCRPGRAAIWTRPFTIDGEFFQAAPGVPDRDHRGRGSALRQAAADERPMPTLAAIVAAELADAGAGRRRRHRGSRPRAPRPRRLRGAVLRQLPARRLSGRSAGRPVPPGRRLRGGAPARR